MSVRDLATRRPPPEPLLRRTWRIREYLLIGALLSAPWLALLAGLSGIVIIETLLLAVAGIAAVVVLRGDWRLFGPQFYYDVVCLARRGRSVNVRVLYVTILLLGLAFVYVSALQQRHADWSIQEVHFDSGPAMDRNEVAAFAARFVRVVILLQNVAVVLLTPIYAATAISEERERGTLELMFTSHLSDREIVLGKLAGRLLHIGGVLLAGLPVLSLAQFLGGIDMRVLLANFALTAMNLVSVGAVCILVSVHNRKALTSVLISYAVLLVPVALFACVSWSIMAGDAAFFGRAGGASDDHVLETLGGMLLLHGTVTATCLAVAIVGLRLLRQQEHFPQAGDYVLGLSEREAVRGRDLAPEEKIVLHLPTRSRPPIQDNPLLWKEMNQGGGIIAFSPAFWVPFGSVVVPMLLMVIGGVLHGNDKSHFGFLRFLLILVGGQFCLGVAYRSCAGIAGERQQGTLDALLTLPVDRREILQAKWLGCIGKGWGWAVFYAPILFLAMVGDGVNPLCAGVILIDAAFLCSLGLLLSITAPSVLAAQTRMVLFLLFLAGMYLIDGLVGNSGWVGRLNDFFNPLLTWEFLTRPRDDNHSLAGSIEFPYRWAAALTNMAWFAGLAILLWRLACWRFDRTAFGSPRDRSPLAA